MFTMALTWRLFACTILCIWVGLPGSTGQQTCPPPNFDSVPNFNLSQYIAAPWYIQQQMVNSYQTAQDLYCVRAKYVADDPNDFSKGITVENYRNRGGVNMNPGGSSGAGGSNCTGLDALKAFPSQPSSNSATTASKLEVVPAALASIPGARGPYWVVAVGPSQNSTIGYDWAIISAGAPTMATGNGCRTGSADMQLDPRVVNGVGLWLFSRTPSDPQATQTMRAKAQDLGFDTSVLMQVNQTGCTYVNADSQCGPVPTGLGAIGITPQDCNRAFDLLGNLSFIPQDIRNRCNQLAGNGTGNTSASSHAVVGQRLNLGNVLLYGLAVLLVLVQCVL